MVAAESYAKQQSRNEEPSGSDVQVAGPVASPEPSPEGGAGPDLGRSPKPARRVPLAAKVAIVVVSVILLVAISLCWAFVARANSYEGRFLPGTLIQSVDVSGMDASEAIDAVSESFSDSSAILVETGHEDIVITGSELGLSPASGEVDNLLATQSKWDWLSAEMSPEKDHPIGVTYDSERLAQIVEGLECIDPDKRIAPVNAGIEYSEADGEFVAYDATPGDLVDKGELYPAISALIPSGGGVIDVTEFYVSPEITADSKEITDAVDEANRIISKTIRYNIDGIDDAETLTKDQIVSFVTLGEDDKLAANEEAIRQWLREIGKEYDTKGQEIRYTTAYGKEAVLPTGVLGWETDEAAMLPVVVENLLGDESTVDQDFQYKREGLWAKGASPTFGSKYVDIDLSDQRVRLIENGEIIHDLVTVTGSNDGRHNTPEGAWEINFKAAPYVMHGADENGDGKEDYVTSTECFANFVNGCALHEMASRGNWSPTAWLHHGGSHGCANLKRADAWTAYNFVEYGTPVLVHM